MVGAGAGAATGAAMGAATGAATGAPTAPACIANRGVVCVAILLASRLGVCADGVITACARAWERVRCMVDLRGQRGQGGEQGGETERQRCSNDKNNDALRMKKAQHAFCPKHLPPAD